MKEKTVKKLEKVVDHYDKIVDLLYKIYEEAYASDTEYLEGIPFTTLTREWLRDVAHDRTFFRSKATLLRKSLHVQ